MTISWPNFHWPNFVTMKTVWQSLSIPKSSERKKKINRVSHPLAHYWWFSLLCKREKRGDPKRFGFDLQKQPSIGPPTNQISSSSSYVFLSLTLIYPTSCALCHKNVSLVLPSVVHVHVHIRIHIRIFLSTIHLICHLMYQENNKAFCSHELYMWTYCNFFSIFQGFLLYRHNVTYNSGLGFSILSRLGL